LDFASIGFDFPSSGLDSASIGFDNISFGFVMSPVSRETATAVPAADDGSARRG
jgi:hypothetical protein